MGRDHDREGEAEAAEAAEAEAVAEALDDMGGIGELAEATEERRRLRVVLARVDTELAIAGAAIRSAEKAIGSTLGPPPPPAELSGECGPRSLIFTSPCVGCGRSVDVTGIKCGDCAGDGPPYEAKPAECGRCAAAARLLEDAKRYAPRALRDAIGGWLACVAQTGDGHPPAVVLERCDACPCVAYDVEAEPPIWGRCCHPEAPAKGPIDPFASPPVDCPCRSGWIFTVAP